ncbi:MAG: hypothetical protein RL115_446 [Bacteroidota bacterium]|jgi:hypothetical protein
MKDLIKIIASILIGLFVTFIFFKIVTTFSDQYEKEMLEEINNYPVRIEGVITDKHSLNGASIEADYWINENKYHLRYPISYEQHVKFKIGQKIWIRYSSRNPNKAIIEID